MIEIPVVFYRSPTGTEPVQDWLRGLPEGDRRAIGADLALVQVGWPVGMPLCRPLSGGLWEVRSDLPSRRIARLLFFVHENRIGVVGLGEASVRRMAAQFGGVTFTLHVGHSRPQRLNLGGEGR